MMKYPFLEKPFTDELNKREVELRKYVREHQSEAMIKDACRFLLFMNTASIEDIAASMLHEQKMAGMIVDLAIYAFMKVNQEVQKENLVSN